MKNGRPIKNIDINAAKQLYEKGVSTNIIAKQLGVSPVIIVRNLKNIGVLVKKGELKRRKFTAVEVEQIIKKYCLDHDKIKNIALDIGCSDYQVTRVLNDNGIRLSNYNRRYYFDEDYFKEINTPEKAYWLGFFYADANVYNYNISINLCKEDKYLLSVFARQIGYEGKIKDITIERKGKLYKLARMDIYSKRMTIDLGRHGVVPNKTFKLKFPKFLEKNLYNHFIRGLFDGDGGIFLGKLNGYSTQVFYIIGQEELLDEVNNIICYAINRKPLKLYKKNGENAFEIRYGGLSDVLNICKWLYTDTELFIKRKFNKFMMLTKE